MSRRRKSNRPRATRRPQSVSGDDVASSPLRRAIESGEHFHLGSSLIDRCGSIDSVEALTGEPLPPLPFRWSVVPTEDRAVVEAILRLIEPVCADRLDSEYAVVMNRLIEFAAVHPERPLRTRTSPDRLAAALTWVALVGNMDRLVMSSRGAGGVWWWFDVTSCTRLARKLATTLGFRPEPRFGEAVGWDEDRGVYLRDVGLLTSHCRTELISHRERVNELISEDEERRRQMRPMVHDGDQVRMRLVETEFAFSARTSLGGGRQVIVLGLGGSRSDPDDMFALSIPEARRLLVGVQSAIDSLPLPVSVEQDPLLAW